MDRMLAGMRLPWPTRARFLERNFRRYRQAGSDPEATAFIDGSVLNNKPFSEAIRSIRGRPAYREVDRRLVYVDPDPRQSAPPVAGRIPGFFSTLKAALSDIPRNEPIADELDWVVGFNERVRRLRAIVEAARPQISRLVLDVTPAATDRPFTTGDIRGWRESVNVRVAESAGFAYEGYVRLKLSSALGFVARVIARSLRRRGALARRAGDLRDGLRLGADRGHRLSQRRDPCARPRRARRSPAACRPGSSSCWISTPSSASAA